MPPNTYPARVGEVRFKLETTTAAPIASPAFWGTSPKQLRAWDVKPGNTRDAEDDPSLVAHPLEDRQRLLLGKKSALSWTSWLTGLATTTPAQDALGLFLKGALGGESLGGASTTVDAANTGAGASAPLLVVAGAGFSVGQAVKVVTPTRTELRRIVGRNGNAVTLDQDLFTVPTSGTVLGSATYFPDSAALSDLNNAGHLTFAALFRGAHPSEQVQHRGCFFGVELADLGQNKRPKVQCFANGQDWEYTSGVTTLAAFSEPAAPNQVNNGLYIAAQDSNGFNPVHTADIDIKLGLSVDALLSPVGKNGVVGHLAFGGRTTLEFTTFFAVADWFDQFEAGTKFYAGYQVGNHVLITLPQLTIDEAPEASGAGAQPRSVKVKFHADNGPLGTSDLRMARFAIHRFGGT